MQIEGKGRPRPRGQLETLEADDLILALGQDTDTDTDAAFLRKIPGVEFKDDGTVIVTQMMTDYPGLFAGGDMVPSEVHRYHLRRARQEGGAQHRRLPSGPELHQAAQAAEEGPGHRSTSCTWYYTGVEQRPQPHADIQRRCTRWCRARAGEGSSVLPLSCGNASSATGPAPRTRSPSSGGASATSTSTNCARVARSASSSVRAIRQHDPGTEPRRLTARTD
jgi:hypothetical protein